MLRASTLSDAATKARPQEESRKATSYDTLVVPYDFSPNARAALATAIELAKRLHSELHLVHVLQIPAYIYVHPAGGLAGAPVPPVDPEAIRKSALDALWGVAREARGVPGLVEPHVVEGANVAETIRITAENLGAELIVMGTHGRTGLAHVLLGSVAERTLRVAACPVVIVKAREDREA